VQFFYEWNERVDGKGQWWRTYGLEVSGILAQLSFAYHSLVSFLTSVPSPRSFVSGCSAPPNGLMRKRMMSGNDVKISDDERWFKDGVDVDSVDISERHL
jgi:uncharacterized protein